MTVANKNIIETYAKLFEGLEPSTKEKLIARLSKPVKKTKVSKEEAFYKSFGAFPADTSAEEIIKEIKAARKFNEKDLLF